MNVVCTHTFLPTDTNLLNHDLRDFLNEGDMFEVFGIRIGAKGVYFLLYLKNEHLIEAPATMFDILDPRVPNFWEARIVEDDLCLWPSIFYKPFFFDDFSDFSHEEREIFQQFLNQYFP